METKGLSYKLGFRFVVKGLLMIPLMLVIFMVGGMDIEQLPVLLVGVFFILVGVIIGMGIFIMVIRFDENHPVTTP